MKSFVRKISVGM